MTNDPCQWCISLIDFASGNHVLSCSIKTERSQCQYSRSRHNSGQWVAALPEPRRKVASAVLCLLLHRNPESLRCQCRLPIRLDLRFCVEFFMKNHVYRWQSCCLLCSGPLSGNTAYWFPAQSHVEPRGATWSLLDEVQTLRRPCMHLAQCLSPTRTSVKANSETPQWNPTHAEWWAILKVSPGWFEWVRFLRPKPIPSLQGYKHVINFINARKWQISKTSASACHLLMKADSKTVHLPNFIHTRPGKTGLQHLDSLAMLLQEWSSRTWLSWYPLLN